MKKVKHSEAEIMTAIKLKKSGMTIKEISNRINVPYGTVYEWVSREKNTESTGFNSDRHLCKTCQFRMGIHERKELCGNCNYIEIVGRSRGCDVECCDKYIKGVKIRKPKKFIDWEEVKKNEKKKYEPSTCNGIKED